MMLLNGHDSVRARPARILPSRYFRARRVGSAAATYAMIRIPRYDAG
jgi:hypothetical protein